MAVAYTFKEDGLLTIRNAKNADPQRIGEALEAIAKANGGEITPPAVVESARAQRHPLHRHFEWDDAVAAEAFRLDQARMLIRAIHIVDKERPEPPRAFLSIADKGGTSYRRLEDVKDSAGLQALVLEAAERDLKAFEVRYSELQDVCSAVRDAREKIAKRRARDDGLSPSS